MKSLAKWLLLGFIGLAIYGAGHTALSPILDPGIILSTVKSESLHAPNALFDAAVPVAIGVAVLIGIVMSVAFFFNKGKGG